MAKVNFKQLSEQIRNLGLKVTPARLTIWHILQSQTAPQTVAQIKQRLGQAQIDPVTIYRNLESLVKLGAVKKVLLDDDEAFYELNLGHHHHLVCNNCGRIEDFEGCDTKSLIKQALKQSRYFGQVNEHSLELFGLCNLCH